MENMENPELRKSFVLGKETNGPPQAHDLHIHECAQCTQCPSHTCTSFWMTFAALVCALQCTTATEDPMMRPKQYSSSVLLPHPSGPTYRHSDERNERKSGFAVVAKWQHVGHSRRGGAQTQHKGNREAARKGSTSSDPTLLNPHDTPKQAPMRTPIPVPRTPPPPHARTHTHQDEGLPALEPGCNEGQVLLHVLQGHHGSMSGEKR